MQKIFLIKNNTYFGSGQYIQYTSICTIYSIANQLFDILL